MRSRIKSIITRIPPFNWAYRLRIRILQWNRRNITVRDLGRENRIIIPRSTYADDLLITFRGSHNTVTLGEQCIFKGSNAIFVDGDGNSVSIGANTTMDQDVELVVAEGTRLSVGKGCFIARGVTIRTSDQHPIVDGGGNRINPPRDVAVGNHVWLGTRVVVMKGVTIGSGSIVGLGSMVTHNIPAGVIAAGCPAKVMKTDISWHE